MSFALQPGMLENTPDLQTACYDICTLILDAHDLEYKLPLLRMQSLSEIRISVYFSNETFFIKSQYKNLAVSIPIFQIAFPKKFNDETTIQFTFFKHILYLDRIKTKNLRYKKIQEFINALIVSLEGKNLELEKFKANFCVEFVRILKLNLSQNILL
jgi:hypothetical protein